MEILEVIYEYIGAIKKTKTNIYIYTTWVFYIKTCGQEKVGLYTLPKYFSKIHEHKVKTIFTYHNNQPYTSSSIIHGAGHYY